MSQSVDNLINEINNLTQRLKRFMKDGLINWQIQQDIKLCKAKAQGMIEILEDEFGFYEKNYDTKLQEGEEPDLIDDRIKEIQSDLIKLKEILK